MTDDSEIRAALEGFAALAPDPAHVRSTLDSRMRTYRQRRFLLAAGVTTAAAAAVGVPAVLLLGRHRAPNPPQFPPATPEPTPSGGNVRYPLRVRATWLPAGMQEFFRAVDLIGLQQELHGYGGADTILHPGFSDSSNGSTGITLSVSRVPPPTPADTNTYAYSPSPRFTGSPPVNPGISNNPGSPQPLPSGYGETHVDINGRTGLLRWYGGPAQLDWRLTDTLDAEVYVALEDHADQVALSFARGLVDDGTTGVEAVLSFGWQPDWFKAHSSTVSLIGTKARWQQSLVVESSGRSGAVGTSVDIVAMYGRGTPYETAPTGGERVTVRGRPAQFLGSTYSVAIAQELDDGHWLRVNYNADGVTPAELRATVLHVAESLRIGPDPYVGWMP
jgi:hypothetical protein